MLAELSSTRCRIICGIQRVGSRAYNPYIPWHACDRTILNFELLYYEFKIVYRMWYSNQKKLNNKVLCVALKRDFVTSEHSTKIICKDID